MTSEKNRKVTKDGHILTNGESFGYVVVLGNGANPDDWYDIPIAEYERIERERLERALAEAEAEDDA